MEKIYHANSNQNILNEIDFKTKFTTQGEI